VRKCNNDILESVATTIELSALVYLQHVLEFNTPSSWETGAGPSPPILDSRYTDITLDKQGNIVLHNVVDAIAFALDAKYSYLVFTVARGCEDDVGSGSGHDGLGWGSDTADMIVDKMCAQAKGMTHE
jgi:hypothetical protein